MCAVLSRGWKVCHSVYLFPLVVPYPSLLLKVSFLFFRVVFQPLTRARVRNDARPGARQDKIFNIYWIGGAFTFGWGGVALFLHKLCFVLCMVISVIKYTHWLFVLLILNVKKAVLSFVFKTIVIVVHPFPSSPWSPFAGRGVSDFFALFPAAPPPFPAQFREWGKQKVILFLSMSIVTQCIKQSKYTILRGNEKNVRRGREGVRLSLCLFF